MKHITKSILCFALLAVMVFSFAACSAGITDKIAGKWNMKSVNGVDFAKYCEDNNLDPATADSVWEISADKAKVTGNGATVEYKIVIKADGFEVYLPESEEVFMSVRFDEEKDELSYRVKITADTPEVEYTLKRA